ncbi:MAG: hypothetical protein A3J79_03215 [Elusimicrobia bacterium RIFOXYB2_FULL_62_6]|nr:MAG: hypothetical protein A3J79_03215 [Elusimicrobia bacterium RIFOXYB2_FULL_62_6]
MKPVARPGRKRSSQTKRIISREDKAASPTQRLQQASICSDAAKTLFFAGLKAQGFTLSEARNLWQTHSRP